MTHWCGSLFAAVATLAPGPLGAPSPLVNAVPASAIAAYFFHPDAISPDQNTQPPGTVQLLSRLAEQASKWGVFSNVDISVRVWIDVLSALETLTTFPHAAILLDIDAAPRSDGGHELSRCQAALLIHTGPDPSSVDRRIQNLLAKYTNNEHAQLTQSTIQNRPVQLLRDKRLPDWAVIQWGRRGDLYVITIGDQAYEKIAAASEDPSGRLIQDRWFGQAFDQLRVPDAKAALYVNLRRAGTMGDTGLKEKIAEVQRVLRLEGSSQLMATLKQSGRAVLLQASTEKDTQTVHRLLARPLTASEESTIPRDAAWVMSLDVTPSELYKMGWDAYLAAKSPPARQSCLDSWRQMESASQVVIERDVLDHLRAPIVVHNYPPHALGIPLAVTVQIPVSGDVAALRAKVDRLCQYAQEQLKGASILSLVHDPDGTWFIRFGLDGPGVVVTDRDVVISFSPAAIRQTLAARTTTTPPSAP
ncbi:MAG: hypothetical protein AABZ47_02710 [Planctomycetota bacterium]